MANPTWEETEEIVDSAPKWEETEELESSKEILQPQDPSQTAATLTGVGVGMAADKGLQKVGSGLKNTASKLAYSAIGGEKTTPGRKLTESALSRYDVPDTITPASIGEKVLNEGLTPYPVARGIEDSYVKNAEVLKQNINKTNELLSKIKKPVSMKRLFQSYSDNLLNTLDMTKEDDRAVFNKLAQEEKEFLSSPNKTVLELEQDKRLLQAKTSKFDPKASVKDKMNAAKAKAYKETVESAIENQAGNETLDQFKALKMESGERGIIQDILKKSAPGQTAFSKSGIIDSMLQSLKGPVAKGMDVAGNVLTSAPVKAISKTLPAVGAMAAYGTARASGEPVMEAGKEAAASLLPPQIEALMASKIGSNKDIEDPVRQEAKLAKNNNISSLMNITEEELTQAAQQTDPSSTINSLLKNLATSDKDRRKAMLFSAMQNPALRQQLKRTLPNYFKE
jgi:hypothetical protein